METHQNIINFMIVERYISIICFKINLFYSYTKWTFKNTGVFHSDKLTHSLELETFIKLYHGTI